MIRRPLISFEIPVSDCARRAWNLPEDQQTMVVLILPRRTSAPAVSPGESPSAAVKDGE